MTTDPITETPIMNINTNVNVKKSIEKSIGCMSPHMIHMNHRRSKNVPGSNTV
jgi:hypothetical protein